MEDCNDRTWVDTTQRFLAASCSGIPNASKMRSCASWKELHSEDTVHTLLHVSKRVQHALLESLRFGNLMKEHNCIFSNKPTETTRQQFPNFNTIRVPLLVNFPLAFAHSIHSVTQYDGIILWIGWIVESIWCSGKGSRYCGYFEIVTSASTFRTIE